jgi:hypothetical protein
MHETTLSAWMTRREAAECLRWKLDLLDLNLVPLDKNPAPVPGKLRYQIMVVAGDLRVCILAADVHCMLPRAVSLPTSSSSSRPPEREQPLLQR